MLLCLAFLGYCQCHSWPYNPAKDQYDYVITGIFMCMFLCVRMKTDADDDYVMLTHHFSGPQSNTFAAHVTLR